VHRKPTMADVARLAGVGTMTVSRVLSGTAPVSEGTAKRVQQAIQQLGYRPNELARAFRGQRSRTIGLIIPYLYDPFFAICAHAVTTVAKEHGYSVITTTSSEDPDIEYAEAEQMLQRNVEGMVIIPSRFRQSRLTRALFGKTPVVVFDRPVSDPSVDAVLVENTSGSRRMVRHLIEHGHERISFMGTEQGPVYDQRPASWLSPRHAGGRPDGELLLWLHIEGGYAARGGGSAERKQSAYGFLYFEQSGYTLCLCRIAASRSQGAVRCRVGRLRRLRPGGVDLSASHGRPAASPGVGTGCCEPALRAHRTGRIAEDGKADRIAGRNCAAPLVRVQAPDRCAGEISDFFVAILPANWSMAWRTWEQGQAYLSLDDHAAGNLLAAPSLRAACTLLAIYFAG
jgi:transcriptional regulator with XRE-family HTH domain